VGTGAHITLTLLAMHSVWSIGVPIAIVETLSGVQRRNTPWLGRFGLSVITLLFVFGVMIVWWGNYAETRFIATVPQLAGTAVAVIALIVAAFAVGRHPFARIQRSAPAAWVVGGTALVASTLFFLLLQPSWLGVAAGLAIGVAATAVLVYWSRCRGWSDTHRFAAAAGATMTYMWLGYTQEPVSGTPGVTHVIGSTVVVLGAVAILVLSALTLRREAKPT
jgi:hypothetical protein